MASGDEYGFSFYEGQPIDLTGKHILFPNIIGWAKEYYNLEVIPIFKNNNNTGFTKSQEKLFEILQYYNYDGARDRNPFFESDIIYYDNYEWHVLDVHPKDEIIHCGARFHWPPVNVCANLGMSDFDFMLNIAMTHSAATFIVRGGVKATSSNI